jgi:hypothetical protein
MQCYRHFDGYMPLMKAIRATLGPCVEQTWVALAVNSIIQLLARHELSRLDSVTKHTTASQAPASKPIKRSRHQACTADDEEEHTAKRAPIRANLRRHNTHSHDSCHTMQHSLSAVVRMTRARAVQTATENDKK